MWLSNRRHFLAMTCAVALMGCGFTPVYGPNGSGQALEGAILADAPDTRDEQVLVQQIERRLGRGSAARFGLRYTMDIDQERMAVSASNTTARFNLIGTVDYEVTTLGSDEVILTGSARQFTGYSTTGTTAATLAAERNARERLAVILADQIVTHLMANAQDLSGR